jgi:hypothetical protein
MNNNQRAAELYKLYVALDELITADEMVTYPFMIHLEDLIHDLQLDE